MVILTVFEVNISTVNICLLAVSEQLVVVNIRSIVLKYKFDDVTIRRISVKY